MNEPSVDEIIWDQFVFENPSLHPDCEGRNHSTGTQGHDDGPAGFLVDARCLECQWVGQALLCEGRVTAITQSLCMMTCPTCGDVDTWESFWPRIERLSMARES